MNDIRALIDAGIDGTIVGKAFYEGTLDLEEAFKAAQEASISRDPAQKGSK